MNWPGLFVVVIYVQRSMVLQSKNMNWPGLPVVMIYVQRSMVLKPLIGQGYLWLLVSSDANFSALHAIHHTKLTAFLVAKLATQPSNRL
eukprot:1153816-Pelagomonas_calceolata.AAC.5